MKAEVYKPLYAGLKRLHRKLRNRVRSVANEEGALESDMALHDLQLQMLPQETPQLPGFQIACAWQPSRNVSGDYLDVFPLGKDRLGLCIADVSGKGALATERMANLRSLVKSLASESLSPALFCSHLNRRLCEGSDHGNYVALLYAVLDQRTRRVLYESAGHCLPLLMRRDGTIEILRASSGVLGLFSHWTFSDHELQLRPGDVLVMATDGVIGAKSEQDEEFGYQRLIESVQASYKQGADGIRRGILKDVSLFCNGNFDDDASLIVVTVDDGGPDA